MRITRRLQQRQQIKQMKQKQKMQKPKQILQKQKQYRQSLNLNEWKKLPKVTKVRYSPQIWGNRRGNK